jgi:hypothetical protein
MKATAIKLGTGHLSLVSHPEEVADPSLQKAGVSPEVTPKDAITGRS